MYYTSHVKYFFDQFTIPRVFVKLHLKVHEKGAVSVQSPYFIILSNAAEKAATSWVHICLPFFVSVCHLKY